LATMKLLASLEAYADTLGVRIREAAVPGTWWGLYDHRYRLITLKPGLCLAQWRSTLAHELGHATYGHHGHHPKTERIADKWAAGHLLSTDLIMLHAKTTVNLGDLAASLDVMPWVVRTFIDLLTETELRWMIGELRDVYV